MAQITLCDRCGNKTTDYENISTTADRSAWQLCGECMKDLRAWIRSGREKA